MDLAFVPGPVTDLVAVIPEAVPGHMPEHARLVDPATAEVVVDLAERVGPSRGARDAARRIDALVTEATHRAHCAPAKRTPSDPRDCEGPAHRN